MCNNVNMRFSRVAKNDEFFTLYDDVAAEIMRYAPYLRGKRILCPFSDHRYSKVVRFLKDYFHVLGLAHLTATCIDNGGGAWRYDYDGKTETVIPLTQGGSFDSQEVTEIMYRSDVVIDNPPFSKFRIIFLWLVNAPGLRNNFIINN